MEKYEHINLEDYFQTGEGGTALSYNHKDGKTLAKLFMPGVGAQTAEREFLVNKTVFEMGIPTPEPIRLVTDGTRFGAEYELIPNKRSFTRIISQEPAQLEPLSLRFAQLAKQLHNTPADTTRLPAMKDLVRTQILRYQRLPEDVREKALQRLDTIPDTTTCLHGDLHIGNIITDGERTLWIDVGDFAFGAPEWDLCMLFYSANFMNEQRADNIFHLTPDVLKKHWALFAKAYYGITDEGELMEKERALYPYFALKLLFVIGKLHDGLDVPSDAVIGLVRRYL
ncbi:MAG: TIGR02172 family protein [Bacteroidales bacterium]|nr:TIGR02172 family protein [Bacteroidales bacterium]MBR1782454.1 TIGR02172 family protein [Bacteroidales bacterium]